MMFCSTYYVYICPLRYLLNLRHISPHIVNLSKCFRKDNWQKFYLSLISLFWRGLRYKVHPPIRRMLLQSHKFWDHFINQVELKRTNWSFFEKFTVALPGLGSQGRGDGPSALITRFFKQKVFMYKINLQSNRRIKVSNPRVWHKCLSLMSVVFLSRDLCDGTINGPVES